jgi:hypothetical protein
MTYTRDDIGTRVQLHAATDEWMQGDRYGEIVGFGRKREYVDTFTNEHTFETPVRVKLDKSGRVKRFHSTHIYRLA